MTPPFTQGRLWCGAKPYNTHYTGHDWGMSQNYHLSLDTSLVGVDRCAQLIADVARVPGEIKL